MFKQWNAKAKPWFQIKIPPKKTDDLGYILRQIGATRSNLSAAVLLAQLPKEELAFFGRCWKNWRDQITRKGYDVYPANFGRIPKAEGKVIYTCSPKLTEAKRLLIVPGLKKNNQKYLAPISLVMLPPTKPFPLSHPLGLLPPHWRGILGELELFLIHVKIQKNLWSGIESIDKENLIRVSKHRKDIIKEIKRREDALNRSVLKNSSKYQIASDYWRVEECFWGILHYDGRPIGHSFFDVLRKRIREWNFALRKEDQITIRDFVANRDTLASVNPYISSMVLKKKKNIDPGTVLRQLRPMISVQENNANRVSKGRVIST